MEDMNKGMRVFFLGAKQAGSIGLLTVAAAGYRIQTVVAYDQSVLELARELAIPTLSSLRQPDIQESLLGVDLLVSVHGREIVPRELLVLPRLGSINVHPCLYRYKGANPVGRLLAEGCTLASVGVHRMTETVDEGDVLIEEFVDVTGKQTADEVYNALYPNYSLALLKALRLLEHSSGEAKH